jgi:hypothetical protein
VFSVTPLEAELLRQIPCERPVKAARIIPALCRGKGGVDEESVRQAIRMLIARDIVASWSPGSAM